MAKYQQRLYAFTKGHTLSKTFILVKITEGDEAPKNHVERSDGRQGIPFKGFCRRFYCASPILRTCYAAVGSFGRKQLTNIHKSPKKSRIWPDFTLQYF